MIAAKKRKTKPCRPSKELVSAAADFKAQVKSAAALRQIKLGELAKLIDKPKSTLSQALRLPWKFRRVVTSLESELFGGRVVYVGIKPSNKKEGAK